MRTSRSCPACLRPRAAASWRPQRRPRLRQPAACLTGTSQTSSLPTAAWCGDERAGKGAAAGARPHSYSTSGMAVAWAVCCAAVQALSLAPASAAACCLVPTLAQASPPPPRPPWPQVDTLSLRHWDQDDPHEMFGAHCFVPGGRRMSGAHCLCWPWGRRRRTARLAPTSSLPSRSCPAGCNGRWVKELCRGLPIFYGSPVREVRYCATGKPQPGSCLSRPLAIQQKRQRPVC